MMKFLLFYFSLIVSNQTFIKEFHKTPQRVYVERLVVDFNVFLLLFN